MKAITLHGAGDVRVESVPDPRVIDPTDAVVRITTSAVCGSDLHQYHGRVAGLEPGVVMGHEFMGVVEEVGAQVTQVRRGDRVIAPFSISCGTCAWCRMRLPTQCVTTGRAVFGGRFGLQYPGGQAEAIRVPFADFMCEKAPAGMKDEEVFFLGVRRWRPRLHRPLRVLSLVGWAAVALLLQLSLLRSWEILQVG